jgi:hypothetical protein
MRGVLMLEVASELAKTRGWRSNQPLIHMRAQGASEWGVTLFGSDSPAAVPMVARKEVQFAIVNPGAILALASRGLGPFPEPVPVRAITILPQWDGLGFAVTPDTGLTTLSQVRDQKYPLRVTLRGQRDHAQHTIIAEVLKVHGFSLDDIESWGGQILWEPPTPDGRMETVRQGKANSIWDEALPMYADAALDEGLRFLTIEEPERKKLEEMGFIMTSLKAQYPKANHDAACVDFSGWIVYTHADTPDEQVELFCGALEVRKERVPHYASATAPVEAPLPLHDMCKDTREGPMYVPLHPAAERFWKARGYI